jgi:hypothetical protein
MHSFNRILRAAATILCATTLSVGAQVLSTTTISDQFDSGERGGNLDLGPAGSFNGDWSDEASNSGGTSPEVTYRNVFAGQYSKPGTEVESPVLDVTVSNTSPDRSLTIAAIPANTRPGATSPNTAIFIGDDGGYNATAFGDKSSTNYYVSVDLYCPDNRSGPSAGGSNFTRMGISIRNNYVDEPAVDGPGWIEHTVGSYALIYESSIATIFAMKIDPQSTGNDTRGQSFADPHPTLHIIGQQTLSASGWHTFRMQVFNQTVQYLIDDVQMAATADGSYPNGAACLFYRANGTFDNDAATDTQARFDNLRAGPFSIPVVAVENWALYD